MKYWAYVNNEILGPFEKAKLLELPSFSPSLLVCPQTPVGEKTEDWKEAATYPELSALISTGSAHPAGGPGTAPAPSFGEPAAAFKPLSASSLDPVPPSEHGSPGIDITISHLSKSQAEVTPQTSAPHQAAASFDPLTFSQIGRKAEDIAAQAPAAETEVTKEPPQAFQAQPPEAAKPAEEPPTSFAPNPGRAAVSMQNSFEPERFASPQPAAAQPAAAAQPLSAAFGGAGAVNTDALERKIDELSRAAATKQDLAAALDPFRMKLDMMGEVISSIKSSQMQREIMDKLAYLENAVGEVKAGLAQAGGAKKPVADLKMESASDAVFGAHGSSREEKPKAAPAKEAPKPGEIVDQGKQSSGAGAKVGNFFKLAAKLVVTLVLIAAILLGAVIGLKKFGIFDASKFIPFPLPFITGKAEPEAAPQADPFAQAQPPAQPGAQQPAAPAAAPKAEEKEPQIAPEIVYFVRNYRLRPGGASLEDTIYADSAKTGGASSGLNWKVKAAGQDTYEVKGLIAAAGGQAAYSYSVNFAAKQILPLDESGKAAFEAMILENNAVTVSPAKKGRAKAAAKKPAKAPARQVKKAPAPAAKKPAPAVKKVAAPEEEYEYVYEDDDGTG